ncbi:Protein MAIN-LIKE 1 [Bienertia sinuspersici]
MSGLGRGERHNKRSNLHSIVRNTQLTQRERPTAYERARKKKIISFDTSMVKDLPFALEFREQNHYEDQYLDGFERALEHSSKGEGTSSRWISEMGYDVHEDGDDEDEQEEDSDEEDGNREQEDEEEVEKEEEEEEEEEDSPIKLYYLIGSRQRKFQVRGRFGIQKRKEEKRLEEYSELKDAIDGGPTNPVLLKNFRGHVAYYIWHGQDRNVLKGHKQTKQLSKWKPRSGEAKGLIRHSQLSYLVDCMHSNLNMPLISAFVERWNPETNSFHLPFGEMTITLHDVAYILRIPVVGEAIFGNPKSKDLKGHLGGILNMSEVDVNKEYHSGSTLFVDRRLLDEIRVDEIIPMRLISPKTCYRGPKNNKYKCNHDENLRSWETWQHHCIRVCEVGAYRENYATEVIDGYLQYYIPSSRRLQHIGARLYPLHPEVRHRTDDMTLWQCINDVTQQVED